LSLRFPEFGRGHLPRLPSHRNDGLEIVLVEAGALVWQVEGRVEHVPAGSVFFTLPWETHGSALEWEPGHRWSFVVLRLPGARPASPGRSAQIAWPAELGFAHREGRRLARLLLTAGRRTWPAGRELPWLVPRLVAALAGSVPRSEVRALTALVLIALGRALEPAATGRSGGSGLLAPLLCAIIARPVEDWSLARLERESGFGHSRLVDLFRQETGDSPAGYVRRARVERARELLLRTDWSITRIAHECGFGTSQHFARVFRRFCGCSPSGLR
jgi:AraC family L-rhamnose operon regulatory protein RhaS